MRIIYMFLLSNLQDSRFFYKSTSITLMFNQPNNCITSTNEYQVIGNILAFFWQIPQIYPFESIIIGLLICILTYYIAIYNEQLLAHEKLRLAMNMIHNAQMSLTLMRNHLEDIVSTDLPEQTLKKLRKTLEYSDRMIDCYHNVIALDKINKKKISKFPFFEFELYAYILSITNQCCTYANSRKVQLKVNRSVDYISCKMNETVMTAALQYLLNQMIELTAPNGCINIMVSHFTNYWKLSITNCTEAENIPQRMIPSVFALLPFHGFNSLRIVKKIIHLHGGKITGSNYGKTIAFQIIVPKNHHSLDQQFSDKEYSAIEKTAFSTTSSYDKTPADQIQKTVKNPRILLVMADKELSCYLYNALSSFFQVTILEDPELVSKISNRKNLDAIIIDEFVNGVSGDELCIQIKSNRALASTPVVLLINSEDNESYISHISCGADRLELRMVNIGKLKADIRMLIDNHTAQRERIKQFIALNSNITLPAVADKEDENQEFIKKVQNLLEKNLSTEGYTVDMLSMEVGMCRTSFYNKIREVAGKSPTEYVFAFKMNKAKDLLATQQYSITEIATLLGYCDAKYFGKKFKDFYQVCPTKYIQELI